MTLNEFDTKSPTIFGQSAAINARGVGAVNYFDQDNPAVFTSAGPTTILFNPDGTRKATPEIRFKPDFTGIQGTDTSFFVPPELDPNTDVEGNGFPNFFGTSASAPHATAIAALIKQANPNFTPQQIYERLESTARDIGVPGRDDLNGFGLINAYDAIFPVVPANLSFTDDFEDGNLANVYETRSTGDGRIRVSSDNQPLAANQVILDSFPPVIRDRLLPDEQANAGRDSLNELILRVNT
ncbi:MAG: S8 family serine peptidase [Calothrix sp. SM1_7_51]|nr:S8 family serine peptidase [Calothrix sp. SM1_7_51]